MPVLIKPINKLLYLFDRDKKTEYLSMISGDPELLLQSGDIPDCVAYCFKNITVFRLGLWKLDLENVKAILEFVKGKEQYQAALNQQLRDHDKQRTVHGLHFDFQCRDINAEFKMDIALLLYRYNVSDEDEAERNAPRPS